MKTVLYNQSAHTCVLNSPEAKHKWRRLFFKRIIQKNAKPFVLGELRHGHWEDFPENINANEQ